MFEVKHTYNKISKNDRVGMRTQRTKKQNIAINDCTDFVMHISQQTNLSGKRKNLIDYTQKRLEKYARTIKDEQQRMILLALLHDYNKGNVAIAWKRGLPIYIQVTKA